MQYMNATFTIVRVVRPLTCADECDQEQHRNWHSQEPENDEPIFPFSPSRFMISPFPWSGTNLTRFRDDSSERDRPQFVAPEIELPK